MHSIRNRFWALAAALALGMLFVLPAQAVELCSPANAQGVQRCSAGLLADQMNKMQRTQMKSNWCWAASIAMVFAHHGYQVTQQEVVLHQFGHLPDRAVIGRDITRILGFGWRDHAGRGFVPSTTVRDRSTGDLQLADAAVVTELAQDRPLIVGAAGHAMVLVAVDYERSADGTTMRIVGGTVIDPAPGKGVRSLTAHELDPGYIAAVQVDGGQRLALNGTGVQAQ